MKLIFSRTTLSCVFCFALVSCFFPSAFLITFYPKCPSVLIIFKLAIRNVLLYCNLLFKKNVMSLHKCEVMCVSTQVHERLVFLKMLLPDDFSQVCIFRSDFTHCQSPWYSILYWFVVQLIVNSVNNRCYAFEKLIFFTWNWLHFWLWRVLRMDLTSCRCVTH